MNRIIKLYKIQLIIILGVYSINIYCQTNSVNCDSLISVYSEHFAVEKMPELIGGLDSLQSRLIYPKLAIENKIEGKVYLLVIIDSAGNQNCAKVIKGLGYGCDEEAMYLINSSKFYPGLLRNKPYAISLSIPIVFSLADDK